MLQAYIDDSGWDGQSPVFVLAGYLAKKEQWDLFSDEWQAVLDLKEPKELEYLKMSQAYQLKHPHSQFFGWSEADRDERLKKLIFVLNRFAAHGVAQIIPIEPYKRLFTNRFTPGAMDRPYFLAFFGIMARLLGITRQLKLDDKIDFIFDTLGGESRVDLIAQYEQFVAVAPPDLKSLAPVFPKFEREQDFKPLQAADMLAWHIRRYYYDLNRGKIPENEPSNVYLAHMLKLEHDVVDVWTEDKIGQAANTFKKIGHRNRGPFYMSLPDPSSPLNLASSDQKKSS